jgi:cytochrome c biogenesis factor
MIPEIANPFLRLIPAPADGRNLNPLLQVIGMALHPPMLYQRSCASARAGIAGASNAEELS